MAVNVFIRVGSFCHSESFDIAQDKLRRGMERAGMSDMEGKAARVAESKSGDERIQSLTISEISRDVSTSVDMTVE